MFDKRIADEIICRKIWPRYASQEEDENLRKDKWEEKYEGKCVIFWDNTNVDMIFKPSTAINQQITYSRYYASNCSKCSVLIQFCVWLGTEDLWVGAVSDSKYQVFTDIFKKQQEFAENNLMDHIQPFLRTNLILREKNI